MGDERWFEKFQLISGPEINEEMRVDEFPLNDLLGETVWSVLSVMFSELVSSANCE